VHRFLPELLDHIETGRLSPEVIISHRMSLEQAAEGYKIFDKKEGDCRKVILTPGTNHVVEAEIDASTTAMTN
jgi:threonine dehydrogenase-like Zn-dependent dehydrogenase